MAKPRKYLIFCVIAILCTCMIIFVNGCVHERVSNKETTKVMDSYSREVKVPRDVSRIATVGSATRTVVYAGAVDKLVAITEMDRPNELRPYTIAYEQEFNDLPTTNNGNQLNSITVDEEKMLEVNPEVIISSRSADECEELQNRLKIPVVGLNLNGDILDESFSNTIKIVGLAANTSEEANATLGYLRSIYNELKAYVPAAKQNVYRGAINYKGSKDLTGTYSQYGIYKTISANNVADNPNIEGAYDTNLEQILTWNPEFIFMDYQNKGKVAAQMAEHPEVFSQLNAFKNNRAYFVAPYNNNGTNLEYAMCEMYMTAKILYPEQYTNLNLDEKFADIIQHLLRKNVYSDLKARGVYFGPAQF